MWGDTHGFDYDQQDRFVFYERKCNFRFSFNVLYKFLVSPHSSIKVTVHQAINKRHFANNADLLQALKPIADAIGLLESPYTTIASIYFAFIQLYNLYTGVKGNNFVNHV